MSSIAGIVNFDGRPVGRQQVQAMLEAAAYRAPDGMITWAAPKIGMGLGLLKTTPEAALENQPVVSRDSRYALVWDGRLDNRHELLEQLGCSTGVTRASDDAQVALAAFERWGTASIEKLAGDFAFAVWDALRESLTIARDPIGVRPVHFYVGQGFVAFGTEIKQLLALDNVPCAINRETLALYLCGGVTRWGERTFYEGIRRLPGGYMAEVSGRGASVTRYWDPDPWDQLHYPNQEDYIDHFNVILERAVRDRIRSSGPVAIMLSGGLDSSAITCLAGRAGAASGGGEVRAFHRTHSGSPASDRTCVEAVARASGIPVQYVNVDNHWAMKPVERFSCLDEPFAFHFESMHHRELDEAAAAGHRVILTGEGGDEAWHPGYMLYLGDWLMKGRLVSIAKDLRKAAPPYRRLAMRHLRRSVAGRMLHRPGVRGRVPDWVRPAAVDQLQLVSLLGQQQGWTYRDSNYVQHRGFPPFFNAMDRETAEHSMEARHPFWDSRLVEFVFRLPPSVRYQGNLRKQFAKKAMRDLVPQVVIQRAPEGSFSSLFEEGVRRREADRLWALLSQPRLADLGLVDGEMLRNEFTDYLAGDASKWPGLYWALRAEEWLQASDGAFKVGPDPALGRSEPAGGRQIA